MKCLKCKKGKLKFFKTGIRTCPICNARYTGYDKMSVLLNKVKHLVKQHKILKTNLKLLNSI